MLTGLGEVFLWFQADIINLKLEGLKGNFIRKGTLFTSNVANVTLLDPRIRFGSRTSGGGGG